MGKLFGNLFDRLSKIPELAQKIWDKAEPVFSVAANADVGELSKGLSKLGINLSSNTINRATSIQDTLRNSMQAYHDWKSDKGTKSGDYLIRAYTEAITTTDPTPSVASVISTAKESGDFTLMAQGEWLEANVLPMVSDMTDELGLPASVKNDMVVARNDIDEDLSLIAPTNSYSALATPLPPQVDFATNITFEPSNVVIEIEAAGGHSWNAMDPTVQATTQVFVNYREKRPPLTNVFRTDIGSLSRNGGGVAFLAPVATPETLIMTWNGNDAIVSVWVPNNQGLKDTIAYRSGANILTVFCGNDTPNSFVIKQKDSSGNLKNQVDGVSESPFIINLSNGDRLYYESDDVGAIPNGTNPGQAYFRGVSLTWEVLSSDNNDGKMIKDLINTNVAHQIDMRRFPCVECILKRESIAKKSNRPLFLDMVKRYYEVVKISSDPPVDQLPNYIDLRTFFMKSTISTITVQKLYAFVLKYLPSMWSMTLMDGAVTGNELEILF